MRVIFFSIFPFFLFPFFLFFTKFIARFPFCAYAEADAYAYAEADAEADADADAAATRRILVKEMDVKILDQMIRFIYTDAVETEEDNIPALFNAGDRFDIQNLTKYCLERMLNKFDASSAAGYYCLAHLRDHQVLRMKSAKIIRENFEKVRWTEGWTKLKSDSKVLDDFLAESFSPDTFQVDQVDPIEDHGQVYRHGHRGQGYRHGHRFTYNDTGY